MYSPGQLLCYYQLITQYSYLYSYSQIALAIARAITGHTCTSKSTDYCPNRTRKCVINYTYSTMSYKTIHFCRLNDAVPTTVNGSQRQSNTLDSRTPMYSPNYIQTPSDQPPSSQSSTLKKLTINTTSTSMYAEPTNNTIQTVPLPIPIESYSCSYPVNNPQRDSGIILPQSDTFLLLPEIDPADVHIYAEPDEPGFNSQGHEYAELEACVDRYQNSTALHVAGPLPYEVPKVVGGSCVNVTVPEPTDTHTHSQISTEGSLECQNVTCDHPYATLGLPS